MKKKAQKALDQLLAMDATAINRKKFCEDWQKATPMLKAKKQIWHNPENVPASKVPKGWRFLKPHERGEFPGKCRIWCDGEFSDDMWDGTDTVSIYIVPEKCGIPKQETLWAILSHHTKSIVPATVAYLRKDAWAAMESCMVPIESLKQEGHRAVKVTVSYEVKE